MRTLGVDSFSMWSTSWRRVGFEIERARSLIEDATSIQAVITIASSSGVHETNMLLFSRRMATSMSSIATAQMWSSLERSEVKKPSSRNSVTSRSSMRSATSAPDSSKHISRELVLCGRGCRTPFAFGVNSPTSAGGATTVVTSVMRMPMPNISWVR